MGVPTNFSKQITIFKLRRQQIALLPEHVEEANSHGMNMPSVESVLPRQTIIGTDGPVSAPCCKKIQVVFEWHSVRTTQLLQFAEMRLQNG
jgi:hypothetical protein